jgi:hypothetical protein
MKISASCENGAPDEAAAAVAAGARVSPKKPAAMTAAIASASAAVSVF